MSSQTPFNFFIHEPLAFGDIAVKLDASWRVEFEYAENKMTWHKEMLHYWNRVYYCGLDYHNNHFLQCIIFIQSSWRCIFTNI